MELPSVPGVIHHITPRHPHQHAQQATSPPPVSTRQPRPSGDAQNRSTVARQTDVKAAVEGEDGES